MEYEFYFSDGSDPWASQKEYFVQCSSETGHYVFEVCRHHGPSDPEFDPFNTQEEHDAFVKKNYDALVALVQKIEDGH